MKKATNEALEGGCRNASGARFNIEVINHAISVSYIMKSCNRTRDASTFLLITVQNCWFDQAIHPSIYVGTWNFHWIGKLQRFNNEDGSTTRRCSRRGNRPHVWVTISRCGCQCRYLWHMAGFSISGDRKNRDSPCSSIDSTTTRR